MLNVALFLIHLCYQLSENPVGAMNRRRAEGWTPAGVDSMEVVFVVNGVYDENP